MTLVYSIHMARSEAIKRGAHGCRCRSCSMAAGATAGRVQADTNNDGDYLDAADILLHWEPLAGGNSLAAVATNAPEQHHYHFSSRGSLVPSNASFVLTLTPADCNHIASRIISIQPSGRPQITRGDCS
jgi:Tfp pilus assembly protein FimT